MVLVIPWGGASSVFESSPGRPVACSELLVGTVWIREIADREYSAWNVVNKLGRRLCTLEIVAGGNVTRPNEHCDGFG